MRWWPLPVGGAVVTMLSSTSTKAWFRHPPMTDNPASSSAEDRSPRPRRVLLLGATGTIGRATLRALLQRGHEVVCLVRQRADGASAANDRADPAAGVTWRVCNVTDPQSVARDGFRGER